MKKSLVTGAAITVVPRFVVGGGGQPAPSDKINIAVVGTGGRMGVLMEGFTKQPDLGVVALCDVDLPRVTEFAKTKGLQAEIVQDYRRLMDRNDIDAIVVATPDHNHAPVSVAAFEAGKDVYLEKPVSNTIPAAVQILESARKHKRIVQVGTQQRSFPHYHDCMKMIKDGEIGDVLQVIVTQASGGYGGPGRQAPQEPEAVPEGFDWDLWQGPAQWHPYERARRSWRGYYEYGGGGITDWGVHQVDIVHMYMGLDGKVPSITGGVGVPNPNPELVPNTWSINYQYDNFIMTFVSIINPTTDQITGCPIFVGTKGALSVNRWGWELRPNPLGSWILSMGGNRMGMGASIEPRSVYTPDEVAAERASEVVHVRDWLDCIKSRQKPICDIEIGFTSSLPLLIGVQSIRDGRPYGWDPVAKTVKAV